MSGGGGAGDLYARWAAECVVLVACPRCGWWHGLQFWPNWLHDLCPPCRQRAYEAGRLIDALAVDARRAHEFYFQSEGGSA